MIDYDELAANYATYRKVHPRVVQSLIRDAKLTSESRVLEVGCGTGNYAKALSAATGCTCHGIDPSAEMLAKGRDQTRDVQFGQGAAEQLDFADDALDFVFSVDVIHHVGDRTKAFLEAYRVVKPGGQICTVTDSESIIRGRRPLAEYYPETVEVDLNRYPSVNALMDLMANAGFVGIRDTSVRFEYSTNNLDIYRQKAFSCLHLISTEAFQNGLKRMEAQLKVGSIPCESRYLMLWGVKANS